MGDGPSFGAKETASAGGLFLALLAIIRWLMSWASPEQRRIDAEQREELRKRIEHLTKELESADASRTGLQHALDEKHEELREEREQHDAHISRLRDRVNELERKLSDALLNSCDNAPTCEKRLRSSSGKRPAVGKDDP